MPSSVISAFRYQANRRQLDVTFVGGRRYSYHGVSAALAEAMTRALSKGEFFNARIKDHFPFTRETD